MAEQEHEAELDTSKPLTEQTNRELRAKIAKRAAHRPPEHGLNKAIYNSLHAWFTGEFFVKPAMLKPGVPPKYELVEAVVGEAIDAYEYDDFNLHDPDRDGWDDHPVTPLLEYWADEVKSANKDDPPRAMNKDELRAFVSAMDTSGDQRQWSTGN